MDRCFNCMQGDFLSISYEVDGAEEAMEVYLIISVKNNEPRTMKVDIAMCSHCGQLSLKIPQDSIEDGYSAIKDIS